MATRTSTRKFLFERSFDDPARLYLPGERRKSEIAAAEAADAAVREAEAAAEAKAQAVAVETAKPKIKLEFSKAQLDAAREEGYIQGHTKALEEASTAREHYVADAMNLIAQGLGALEEKQQAANEALANDAMRMAYGVVSKLLPEFAHQYAVDNIENFVRRVLPIAVGEPKLLVRSHPMIAPDLEARLKDVFARASFQGTYTVIPDYEIQPGDCRLEWEGGGADRNEGRIWSEIREAVASNFGDIDVNELDAAADQIAQQQPSQAEEPQTQMEETGPGESPAPQ